MSGPANIPDVNYPREPQMTPLGEFIQLDDVPESYEGQSGKVLAVKNTEDGLQFSTGGGGGSSDASLMLNSSGNSTDPDAHPYTADNCGIQVTDANNVEIFRIWAGDPDVSDNYSSGNLYIGFKAGFAQPSGNASSGGFLNTGIGWNSMVAINQGTNNTAVGAQSLNATTDSGANTAVGYQALLLNVSGSYNTAVGMQALGSDQPGGNVTGSFNTSVGCQSMPESAGGAHAGCTALGYRAGENANNDTNCLWVGREAQNTTVSDLDNAIAIGYSVRVSSSNRAVIGNASITDVFVGSETAAAKIHGKGDAIVFPDADPHVAGAAYWVGGVLTKSAG